MKTTIPRCITLNLSEKDEWIMKLIKKKGEELGLKKNALVVRHVLWQEWLKTK